jgi:hypothetical protein
VTGFFLTAAVMAAIPTAEAAYLPSQQSYNFDVILATNAAAGNMAQLRHFSYVAQD